MIQPQSPNEPPSPNSWIVRHHGLLIIRYPLGDRTLPRAVGHPSSNIRITLGIEPLAGCSPASGHSSAPGPAVTLRPTAGSVCPPINSHPQHDGPRRSTEGFAHDYPNTAPGLTGPCHLLRQDRMNGGARMLITCHPRRLEVVCFFAASFVAVSLAYRVIVQCICSSPSHLSITQIIKLASPLPKFYPQDISLQKPCQPMGRKFTHTHTWG